MIRLVAFLLAVLAAAVGLAWLADRPGSLVLHWQGWDIETTLFRAVVLSSLVLAGLVALGSVVRSLLTSPAMVGRFLTQRRQERGLDAISSGLIAIGAGDRTLATRYAVQARKALPNEPLTHLLRAQAAQLSGDRSTSRRIFEAMLGSPDTEQLGLRGLYLEAEREGEREAARQFAERALRLNPRLPWPVDALFDLQCRDRDWPGALETLAAARKHGHIDKATADRRRAVLLTAQAQEAEDESSPKALDLAQEAHGLAPDLIPAAAIAGRQLASRGSTPKAARVIERAWKAAPHPDLALVYAHARPGDSPRDRLERLKRLARSTPHSPEGPIAVATAAIEARDWAEARAALETLLGERMTQRVATLMARIEGGEENTGGVREWLARAVNAPPDPAWTADGLVAERWEATSPVTGQLDAFQWKVPLAATRTAEASEALAKLEELVALGTASGPALPAGPSRVADDLDEYGPAMSKPPAGMEPGRQYYAPPETAARRRSQTAMSEDSIEVDIEKPANNAAHTHDAAGRAKEQAAPVVIIGAEGMGPAAAGSAATAGEPSQAAGNGAHAVKPGANGDGRDHDGTAGSGRIWVAGRAATAGSEPPARPTAIEPGEKR